VIRWAHLTRLLALLLLHRHFDACASFVLGEARGQDAARGPVIELWGVGIVLGRGGNGAARGIVVRV
jgi:hypothetical protein